MTRKTWIISQYINKHGSDGEAVKNEKTQENPTAGEYKIRICLL